MVPKKLTHELSSKAGKWFFLNISKIKQSADKKHMRNSNWYMLEDKILKIKFSSFYITKNSMVESICMKLLEWKKKRLPVDSIWYDNTEENKKLEKKVNEEI